VFGYEPHSVFSIGLVALAHNTALMPLAKTRFLASSVVRVLLLRFSSGKGKYFLITKFFL